VLVTGALTLWRQLTEDDRQARPIPSVKPVFALCALTNDLDLTPTPEPDRQRTIFIAPDRVLATVDGRPITLGDLMPLRPGGRTEGQELSRQAYEYLLGRAIHREVILLTAKTRGIVLTPGQKQHLSDVRARREHPDPGSARSLNRDPHQVDFEAREMEAFLLQSTLLARAGLSPNVSPEQVLAYYQARASEFGEPPSEGNAGREAWAGIDYRIRQRLAGSIRRQFQAESSNYIQQLMTAARVVVSEAPGSVSEP
jgi:hypothetical protein